MYYDIFLVSLFVDFERFHLPLFLFFRAYKLFEMFILFWLLNVLYMACRQGSEMRSQNSFCRNCFKPFRRLFYLSQQTTYCQKTDIEMMLNKRTLLQRNAYICLWKVVQRFHWLSCFLIDCWGKKSLCSEYSYVHMSFTLPL